MSTPDIFDLGATAKQINAVFGRGFAEQHPELIGALLQVQAVERSTVAIIRALVDVTAAIETAANSGDRNKTDRAAWAKLAAEIKSCTATKPHE